MCGARAPPRPVRVPCSMFGTQDGAWPTVGTGRPFEDLTAPSVILTNPGFQRGACGWLAAHCQNIPTASTASSLCTGAPSTFSSFHIMTRIFSIKKKILVPGF